jgi:hypothetical protein
MIGGIGMACQPGFLRAKALPRDMPTKFPLRGLATAAAGSYR